MLQKYRSVESSITACMASGQEPRRGKHSMLKTGGMVGFQRGNATWVGCFLAGRDLGVVVHGDDFTFYGLEEDLKWIREEME